MAKKTLPYVDGFVLVVPKKNLEAYRKMAELGAKVWMKHGALDYKECVGDDMKPNMGDVKLLSFPQMAKSKPSDLIIFSYIVFKSRAHRDRVNAKVMKDPAMNPEVYKDQPMPMDMEKMAYGGFQVLVDGK
jgi:uncharacterized protein YbaA (DUF1428 family)